MKRKIITFVAVVVILSIAGVTIASAEQTACEKVQNGTANQSSYEECIETKNEVINSKNEEISELKNERDKWHNKWVEASSPGSQPKGWKKAAKKIGAWDPDADKAAYIIKKNYGGGPTLYQFVGKGNCNEGTGKGDKCKSFNGVKNSWQLIGPMGGSSSRTSETVEVQLVYTLPGYENKTHNMTWSEFDNFADAIEQQGRQPSASIAYANWMQNKGEDYRDMLAGSGLLLLMSIYGIFHLARFTEASTESAREKLRKWSRRTTNDSSTSNSKILVNYLTRREGGIIGMMGTSLIIYGSFMDKSMWITGLGVVLGLLGFMTLLSWRVFR